jgi:serine/threonine protein phosphatase 1
MTQPRGRFAKVLLERFSAISRRAVAAATFQAGTAKAADTDGSSARRDRSGEPSRVTHAPEGRCLYAVGDIHGRYDLLVRLLDTIREDAAQLPDGTRPQIIFLGDYIDRGLQSREVLDLFLSGELDEFDPVYLMGNHEEAMLRFFDDMSFGAQWAQYGGGETLFSYGLKPPNQRASLASHEAMTAVRSQWQALWTDFRTRVPAEHMQFLRDLKAYHVSGDYLFVHAGLRPGVELEAQTLRDMLWIRDEFLDDDCIFDHLIVHGHTPIQEIHHDNRRIGLDTGAFITGRLSTARLCGTEIAFLRT